jgi:hypothetical protein
MKKKNDKGLAELLELLRTRPDLIDALVFDPARVKGLLQQKAARRMVLGVSTKAFLRYVSGSSDGGPIAICLRRTVQLCAVGTGCAGGTIFCPGGTNTGR